MKEFQIYEELKRSIQKEYDRTFQAALCNLTTQMEPLPKSIFTCYCLIQMKLNVLTPFSLLPFLRQY